MNYQEFINLLDTFVIICKALKHDAEWTSVNTCQLDNCEVVFYRGSDEVHIACDNDGVEFVVGYEDCITLLRFLLKM